MSEQDFTIISDILIDLDGSEDGNGDVWHIPEAFEALNRLRARVAELEVALREAIRIAEDARKEWDAAPNGMRAGKILIALAGGCPGYRSDIDAVHAVLAQAPDNAKEVMPNSLGHQASDTTQPRPAQSPAGATLPDARCDTCDNGIDRAWNYCAWCGGSKTWARIGTAALGASEPR